MGLRAWRAYGGGVSPSIATARHVTRDEMLAFIKPRHRAVLVTRRRDGGLQTSPVSCGVDADGCVVIATYPDRAKAVNLRADPRATLTIVSDAWNDACVQLDGTAEVIDMPDAEDALVEYFRRISGEHPDWDEYRAAMRFQAKSLIRITIDRWGPIATGGFPPDRVPPPL